MHALFPFVPELRAYGLKTLKRDLVAALTVAAVSIPQAMAYAAIVGIHPKYGLYTAIAPVIVAALWGASRYLQAGPTNTISMMLFSICAQVSVAGVPLAAMSEDMRMPYIFGIALFAGALQVLMGLARFGEMAGYISHAVMTGFITGAALLIAGGQLKHLLGLHFASPGGFFPHIMEVGRHITQVHPWSLAFGLGAMGLVSAFRRFLPRWPGALLTLMLCSLAATLADAKKLGVAMAGAIPPGLPPLSLPPVPDLELMRAFFLPALSIAIVGAVESIAIAKNMAAAKNQDFDPCRELLGQGLGNISAGLCSGIPGCGSLIRSALNFSSGARSRFAGVFTGIFIGLALLVFAPLMDNVPLPALAGLLMVVAWGMIKPEELRFCFKATREDRLVLLSSLGAALFFDLEIAILLGVLLSLVLFVRKTSHVVLQRVPAGHPVFKSFPWARDCPNLALFFMSGTLFFGAISKLERQLREHERDFPRILVLHLNRVFWIDASGVHALGQFFERCLARGLIPVLVHDSEAVCAILERTGMLDHLGEGFVARDLHDALAFAKSLLEKRLCRQGGCAREGGEVSCPFPALPFPGP
jgi:SulP family sulfate permease